MLSLVDGEENGKDLGGEDFVDPNIKQNRSTRRGKGSGRRDIFNKAKVKSGQSFNVGQGNKKGTIGPIGSQQAGWESIHLKWVVIGTKAQSKGNAQMNELGFFNLIKLKNKKGCCQFCVARTDKGFRPNLEKTLKLQNWARLFRIGL